MTDILLALCVGAAFALGYLPVKRLDRFPDRNREADEVRRRADTDPPAEGCAPRGRDPGRGFALGGGWRGGGLFPLRHRG